MKKLLKILLVLTGILTILNIVFRISFTSDIIDTVILVAFGLSVIIYLTLLFQRVWMRVILIGLLSCLTIFCSFAWQIFGYESRTDKIWDLDNYNIQLQHRLEIAGPGCFWFLVNKELIWGVLEKRIETRQYQAGLPDPPEIFKFITSDDTLRIECCKNNLIILSDSLTYVKKIEYIKELTTEKNE